MAKTKARKTRVVHSDETKLQAVKALVNGATPKELIAKYDIAHSVLYKWRHKLYKNGRFVDGTAAAKSPKQRVAVELEPDESQGLTPEQLFGKRVQKAIITLRDAWKQVKEMEAAGKLAEPDTAHLLANLALKYLQGDYGR